MTVYYVGSSVWVKRYYEEIGTPGVQQLFSGEHVLACSGLGLVEVTATLSRKQRAAELSVQDRDESLAEVEQDWQRFVQIDVLAEIVTGATRLARDFAFRGSDAIHLASAQSAFQRLTGSEHLAVMATCDHELKRAAEALGFVLFDSGGTGQTIATTSVCISPRLTARSRAWRRKDQVGSESECVGASRLAGRPRAGPLHQKKRPLLLFSGSGCQ